MIAFPKIVKSANTKRLKVEIRASTTTTPPVTPPKGEKPPLPPERLPPCPIGTDGDDDFVTAMNTDSVFGEPPVPGLPLIPGKNCNPNPPGQSPNCQNTSNVDMRYDENVIHTVEAIEEMKKSSNKLEQNTAEWLMPKDPNQKSKQNLDVTHPTIYSKFKFYEVQ